MTNTRKNFKKILSVIVCIALLMSYLPSLLTASAAPAEQSYYKKTVDANSMDGWKNYFDLNNLDTSNAGGVWTDKSVFTDASAFPSSITMIDDEKNFLTALSAIAANKEVVGYSTVPTDTVFILDLSNSMSSTARTQLINATNAAIEKLQNTNNNNRVGVVLYSGEDRSYDDAVARLMPIDRYKTTATDSDDNPVYIEYESGDVALADDRQGRVQVTGSNGAVNSQAKEYGGATYIQAGLWEAYEMFNDVPDTDIYIGNDNWQSGEYRMPIVVLMTDGAPTFGTSYFADVENSRYTTSNWGGSNTVYGADVGDGNSSGITAGQGFLVQLTASYIKNRIENKYKVKESYGAGRSLFYTLGFNINPDNNQNSVSSGDVAHSVVNPDASTITDALWQTYNGAGATMQVPVEGRNGGNSNVTITKNSYATNKSYADGVFSASGDGLNSAFNDIVEEIVLQSRYYPTHLEGGSPDFSGYVTFTDTLGEYMEVKHINGILLGDTLFDGHMMASKISDTSEGGLGNIENPTALGNEFIRSVKTRLGISDNAAAHTLVSKAYADQQLYYRDENNWSNYIAWYAKADGTYLGFYDKDGTEPVPADAVYISRSYGFLGETSGSIKNSDMMYMSVQVLTNIETGKETLIWKIPAALVPMITYLVELDGNSINNAKNVRLSVENADSIAPIRLVYETGLRSDLNEFNISRVQGYSINDTVHETDERHIAADGHTRLFWNNSYDISGNDHTKHKVALAEFTPNKENERFYYTFDSAVYKAVGTDYELVGEGETLDENGIYYHRRYIFAENSTTPVFRFERMSAASIRAAKENGWQANFTTIDNRTVGAWAVPMGTPARELQMYSAEKADDGAATNSAHMVFYPYLSEHNNTYYVDMNLGNNGLLEVTPATGIKISKTVDVFEEGTSDTFKFRITASQSGRFDSWITALDETPEGEATPITLVNGVYEFEMKKDETFWLSGLSAGTTYTVEEISDNADYKIKSVHVNGISTGKTAFGTVAQYVIDDIDFVNTAVGEGDLVITKQVVDTAGNIVNVNDNIKFTAEVTLTDESGSPVSGTFASTDGNITVPANGKFTITLTDGASFIMRGIPEETRYTVVETNIPAGFSLNTEKSLLSGVVDAISNDRALIVNTYKPTSVNGSDVEVLVVKQISGNRTEWLSGESYTFDLERIGTQGAATLVSSNTISNLNADKSALFELSSEIYDAAGTYTYRIRERSGNQGGITYDTAERRFSVTVADADSDGDLEITAVTNIANTIVSGRWVVNANFNNVYAPTGSAGATVNIEKFIAGHSKSGYQFALYDATPEGADANEVIRSGLTAANGRANITLNFSAVDAGKTYTYYLAEIGRGERIKNIQYSDAVYKIEVTVKDNLDGTVSTEIKVDGNAYDGSNIAFTNTYVPSTSDYVTVSGQKKIIGDRALNADEFSFTISAVTAGAPMPAVTTVKNDAFGFFAFSDIEFADSHKGQTFVYEIREDSTGPIGGFKYDNTVYTVTVTVTDNGTSITATPVITLPNSSASDIVFENRYTATPAELELTGTKLLTGKVLEDGEFQFVIERVTAGAPMPYSDAEINAVANYKNGNISFGTLTFTKKGTYIYKIYEQNAGDARYDYDKSVYTVTVTVTDNSEGKLSAAYTLTKDDAPSTEIVFRNGFTPAPINYDIYANFGGEKTLDGRALRDGEFEFVLINAINGQQIGGAVKNDTNGKIAFPAITIHTEGTYHYKVSEVGGDEKGITYDAAVYHVVVGVKQNDSGVLEIVRNELYKATVTADESGNTENYENITDGGKIEFLNTYKADSAEINLGGKKTLAGRALREGEFTFNLYLAVDNNGVWEKGELIEQTQNDADGNFTFKTRISDENAAYAYFITEDATDPDSTITYDTREYLVVVTSTDNLDGTRSVDYEYTLDGETVEGVAFENVYTAPPVVPETGDDGGSQRDFWMLMAFAFISVVGIIATGFTLFKKSEEN